MNLLEVSYTCFWRNPQVRCRSPLLPRSTGVRTRSVQFAYRCGLVPETSQGDPEMADQPKSAADVAADRQGTRRPLRPALVHRRARPAEELLDQRRRARGRLRRRHGLRRLLDHRLQPDRGVGHDRDAGPDHLRADPLAPRGGERGRAHVLRHPRARRRALRGRPALDPAAGAETGRGARLRRLQRRPRARVLLLPLGQTGGRHRPRSSTRAATST